MLRVRLGLIIFHGACDHHKVSIRKIHGLSLMPKENIHELPSILADLSLIIVTVNKTQKKRMENLIRLLTAGIDKNKEGVTLNRGKKINR